MKKTFICILILVITIICTACMNSEQANMANITKLDFQVGMTYTEIITILKDKPFVEFQGYIYFIDSSGRNVILDLHSPVSQKLNEIMVFEAVSPDEKNIERVQRGMTFSEVVSILGFPDEPCVLSGLLASQFNLENGSSVMVYWDNTPTLNPQPITVTYVGLLDFQESVVSTSFNQIRSLTPNTPD